MPDADSNQLSFADMGESFAAAGVAELPQGVGELTHRELRLVLGVLQHGQRARAAIEAGYSADSASSLAAETLQKPKVQAVLAKCLQTAGHDPLQAVRRAMERCALLHARFMAAAQERHDADEWLLAVQKDETTRGTDSKSTKQVREYERVRERAMRDEKHYAGLVHQAEMLLAQLTKQIDGLVVSGEVKHSISAEVRAEIIALRTAVRQREGALAA